jgi:hypothetical protein
VRYTDFNQNVLKHSKSSIMSSCSRFKYRGNFTFSVDYDCLGGEVLQPRKWLPTLHLQAEVAISSEKSVTTYRTTWRHSPEDRNQHLHRREDPKSLPSSSSYEIRRFYLRALQISFTDRKKSDQLTKLYK